MSHYIKRCPECGETNDVLSSNCIYCGCELQVVIPEEVMDENDNASTNENPSINTSQREEVVEVKKVEKPKPRYYKYCRICGNNNYLDNKDDYVPFCKFCQSEELNDEPTLLEKIEEKAPVVQEAVKEEVKQFEGLRLFNFNENKYVEVPKEGGIIGRYGNIDKEYFSKYDHISGNHLRIIFQDNEYYVQDLNSTNGTKINGKKLHSMIKYKIEKGNLLEISILIFEVVR